MDFDSIIEQYKNKTYDELLAEMKEVKDRVIPLISKVMANDKIGAFAFIMFLVATACGADGALDKEEYRFFVKATSYEISFSEMQGYVSTSLLTFQDERVNSIIDLIGRTDSEGKEYLLRFVTILAYANGKLSKKEKTYLKTIFD